MPEPIKLSINVMLIDKEALYPGKNGAKYLNLVLWPSENDKFDNDFRVNQDLPREMRDAGKKGAILGNGKFMFPERARQGGGHQRSPQKQPPAKQTEWTDDGDMSGVPF